ncbi:MAG: vWA domain-containing protein [Bacteroidota bacterium]
MNIIIAVDFSGSEMEYLDEIRTVLLALTDPFELDQAKLKVGIITFNRGAQMVLPLTGETQKMLDAIEGMDIVRMVYATDIHSAISLADQEFAKKTEGQVSNFFILISDGDPHAHARGYGWQSDIYNIERMKEGDIENQDFPIHVFTLYTGNMSSQWGRFSEEIRMASINHMKKMATDEHSFFYFHEHQSLVDFLLLISNCL